MNFVETAQAKNLNDAESALGDVVGSSGIEEKDLGIAAGTVVEGILGAVGLIFFGLMVYAGMKWMLARGEEEKVTKARETIIAASIGLVIIVAAYAITNLVVNRIILQNTGTGEGVTTSGEEPTNTVGGENLGCCILPADYFALGSAIPSVTTGKDCQKKAFEKLGSGDGEEGVSEEDLASVNDSQGSKWEFYDGSYSKEVGKTSVCIGIAKCWVGALDDFEKDQCIGKLF